MVPESNPGICEITLSIASWGMELVNRTNPIFEFHVIIGNGINVLLEAKAINLQEYKRDLSKVIVHIFDQLKKKTLGLGCDPKRLNESLQPLNIERAFNIKKFIEPTWKDLKGRWDEMKVIVDVDKNEHEKAVPPS